MKKIIKWILLILLCLFGIRFLSSIASGIDFFNEKTSLDNNYLNSIKHESDNMLLAYGQFYIQLNESSARSHLNSSTTKKLNDIYGSCIDYFNDKNNDGYLYQFELYLQLQNDLGNKMYVIGIYQVDDSGEIVNCKYKWYDEKIIFNNISNNYTPGTILRAYKGSSLELLDTILYAKFLLDNEELYFDLRTAGSDYITSFEISSLGDMAFDSLFTIGQTVEDNTETTYAMNIDPTILEQYLDGTMTYEHASDTVYDIYQNNYSYELDEENDFLQAIAIEYSYQNPTTLDILKFYVIVNINKEYAGVYYYYKGSYNCLYFNSRKDDILFKEDKVLFDMSNFEPYIDHEDGFAICNFIRETSWNEDGILELNSNTDLIYFSEGDLPLEFISIFN